MADSRRARPQEGRRRGLVEVSSSPHLAELSLAQLRAYRQTLTGEEDRVSYWRRLVHARLDLLEAGSHSEGVLDLTDLVRALGDTGAGTTRRVLVAVRPADPLPDLPVLADMWMSEVDPHDAEALADARHRLREAEQQLADYRQALHQRIDEATGELISRYRQDPASVLSAVL